MKRPVRLALSGAALALCLTAFALPAFATGTETPDVSGSYHPTRAEALEEMIDRNWIRAEGAKTISDKGRMLSVGERYFILNPPGNVFAFES